MLQLRLGGFPLCRELLAVELAALVGESYDRAYPDIVRAQQCTELKEVVEYIRAEHLVKRHIGKGDPGDKESVEDEVEAARARMKLMREEWRMRLLGAERSVDTWTQLLAVRRLVVPPTEDADVYVKYAVMCRKEGREQYGWRTLTQLLGYDPMLIPTGEAGYGAGSPNPMVRALSPGGWVVCLGARAYVAGLRVGKEHWHAG